MSYYSKSQTYGTQSNFPEDGVQCTGGLHG